MAKVKPKPAPRKAAAQSRSAPEKRGRGQPTKFRLEYVAQVRILAERGFTDQEVADFFNVSTVTIWRWKAASPDFCNALKTGKEPADIRVERSLFASAVGYEHDEVDIRVVNGKIVQTPIRKFYPPSAVACIFWLKNRRPDLWRDAAGDKPGDLADLAAALRENMAQANAETAVPASAAS